MSIVNPGTIKFPLQPHTPNSSSTIRRSNSRLLTKNSVPRKKPPPPPPRKKPISSSPNNYINYTLPTQTPKLPPKLSNTRISWDCQAPSNKNVEILPKRAILVNRERSFNRKQEKDRVTLIPQRHSSHVEDSAYPKMSERESLSTPNMKILTRPSFADRFRFTDVEDLPKPGHYSSEPLSFLSQLEY